ncbi:hypothetical protein ABZX85_12165 [Streptomyces sp. NPDC004539]|uniref:hypothetical protein n=1 Tax=Streptomyces sp. NPDC004539 TaxID=3154280 RepID=UPI0033AF9576
MSRKTIGIGVAGLALLGAAVAGTGTASAASSWNAAIVNANIPSGSGSVLIVSRTNGGSGSLEARVCAVPTRGGNLTTTQARVSAGSQITVQGYGDTTCGSGPRTAVTYRFSADDDVRENNLNCTQLALGANTAEHHFRLCS